MKLDEIKKLDPWLKAANAFMRKYKPLYHEKYHYENGVMNVDGEVFLVSKNIKN